MGDLVWIHQQVDVDVGPALCVVVEPVRYRRALHQDGANAARAQCPDHLDRDGVKLENSRRRPYGCLSLRGGGTFGIDD